MKKLMLILMIVPVFFIMSCAGALQVTEVDSWLGTKAAGQAAAVNVTGKWADALNETDSFMSWGQAEFTQKGSSVSGNISSYVIKGIVAGKTVYLVLLNGNVVNYTAKLEMRSSNELYGDYYKARDINQTAPTPMSFKKVK